jgi:predicted nucleic acid-binding protein
VSRYVVDASVVMKWFVPEIHSEAALRLLDDRHELTAPDLVFAEVGNIVWKKVWRREITAVEGRRILRAFRSAPLRIESSSELLAAAFEIATACRRTVYDSLYIALAFAEECRMITADEALVRALLTSPVATRVEFVAAASVV